MTTPKDPPKEPFEKGDVAAEETAIGRLLSYAGDLFWGDLSARLGVDIGDIDTMHMGVYRRLREQKRIAVLDRKDFQIAMRYQLVVDRQPLTIETLDSTTQDDGRPYDVGPYQPSDDLAAVSLLHWDVLGDVSVDDEDELSRVGFPRKFARALGEMSREAREVYKTSIDQIRDRPSALHSVKPRAFLQTLAAYGTYTGSGVLSPAGIYFPKWQAGKEGLGPIPSTFAKEMLEHTTREVILQGKRDYLLLSAKTGYRLLELREKEGVLDFTEIVGSFDSFHDELPKGDRTKYRAIFFHSINGEKVMFDARKRRTYEVTKRGAQRLLLDPRRMVESLTSKSVAAKLGLGDPFDWFVEMVSGYFPSRFYVLDFRDAAVRPMDMAFDSIKKWADDATRHVLSLSKPKNPYLASLSEERKKEILELVGKKDLIVLPQGFRMSPGARFVGADHSWCYARDLKTGAVYAMRHGEFIYDVYVGGVAQLVYEASAGVIPLVGLLFASAAAVPVAIFAGPAAIARWVTKEAARRSAEAIAKDLAIRMVPAMAASMGSLVATFFVYVGDDDETKRKAARWRAFAEGLFKGYIVNTIYDSFFRDTIVKTLAEGIPEYRYYTWAKRIYAAVDKVHSTVKFVEEKLDRKSIDEGINLFEKSIHHFAHGAILLLSALYYSSYDDASAALEVFGAGPDGEPPPNPAEWELEAGNQLAEIASHIEKELSLHDIGELLEGLKSSKLLKVAITAAILHPQIWDALKKTWQGRPFTWKKWEVKWIRPARPAIILVIAASMAGVLVYAQGKTDDKLFDVAGDLIWGLVSDLPGSDEDRARINGEIVGNLLGVFAFNSFIHKEPTFANKKRKWADKSLGEKWQSFMDMPLLGTTMKGATKIGVLKPILKLVFKRYVSLYESLKRKGVFDADRTEATIGDFISKVDDAALENRNLGHLTMFRTDKESAAFSLEHLVVVLFRLRTMLAKDLKAYLNDAYSVPEKQKALEEDWAAFKSLARSSGLSTAIEKHGLAAYKVLAIHLHLAISHLEEALKLLMTPFAGPDDDRVSWFHLFRQLGLDVDIESAEDALEHERQRLAMFQESST